MTVVVIGAGKFGTMFLSQARLTQGMHVVAVADLDVGRARSQLKTAGWPDETYAAPSLADAHKKRTTFVTDDAEALIADPRIEVIIEATGVPGAGIHHEVYRRTGDKPFKNIDDVISREELIALSESYKRVAGYDKERLKSRV